MGRKQADINSDFLHREIGAELHMPITTVKPIIDMIFLKILKHMMYNRTVAIKGFGTFDLVYRKKSLKYNALEKKYYETKPKVVPRFRFYDTATEYVVNSQDEYAQDLARKIKK